MSFNEISVLSLATLVVTTNRANLILRAGFAGRIVTAV